VGTKVLDPLRPCVNVADYCDPSSTDTLTCIKSLVMCVESAFVAVSERFVIAGCFFYFGEDD
jgi:hypothetical protein